MASSAEARKLGVSLILLIGTLWGAESVWAKPQKLLEAAQRELEEVAARWQPFVVRVSTVQEARKIEFRRQGADGEPADVQVRRIYKRAADVPGLIVDPDGYVLTSSDVLTNAHHIVVTLADGRYYRAQKVGEEAGRGLGVVDIGALRIEHLPTGDVQARAGRFAIALAPAEESPLRIDLCLVNEVGSVSVPRRESAHWLQVTGSAALQPGSALVDLEGNLTGVVVGAVRRGSMSLETPKSHLEKRVSVAPDLEEEKTALEPTLSLVAVDGSARGWWAVATPLIQRTLDDILCQEAPSDEETPEDAQGWIGLKLSPGPSYGQDGRRSALVLAVCENGPAKEAGLQPDDRILSYQGRPVTDGRELGGLILGSKPGTRARLVVLREGEEVKLDVSVGAF